MPCAAPVRALVDVPALAVPVIVTWAMLLRFARGWAVPGALIAAVAAIALTGQDAGLADATLRLLVRGKLRRDDQALLAQLLKDAGNPTCPKPAAQAPSP